MVEIVIATENDARNLERIFKGLYKPETKWSEDKIKEKMRKGREYYILNQDGAIELKFEDDKCELVAIAVNPKMKGFGSQLVQFAESLASARKCQRIWCYTLDVNNADEFYKKIGWVQEDFIPEFLEGHDAFKFSRELN
ncbi:MAG: GNAT family N-acetyltransferase [Nanoarchaeota archaeon]|nr:GNAT family N-acetyltransferase [Nanoarchaeota archaeon]